MKQQDNETLTQTNAGTPMGSLFRRYWLPALTVEELPTPDCAPVRIPLLGERLIAFRDSSANVGIVSEVCAHRQASLYFGRVEDCGIRCAYHGWHFDVNGRCLDIPSEPAENKFRDTIRLTAYPSLERGGVIWVYMGDPELQPPPPALEWAGLPIEHLFVSKRLQECNYLQVMEGGLDSSHLSFLHRGTLSDDPVMGTGGPGTDSRILDILATDHNPLYQTMETDGGLMLGARRTAGGDQYYWRVTQFIFPCFNIIARWVTSVSMHRPGYRWMITRAAAGRSTTTSTNRSVPRNAITCVTAADCTWNSCRAPTRAGQIATMTICKTATHRKRV